MRNVKKKNCRQLGALLSFIPVNTWSVAADSIGSLVLKKLIEKNKFGIHLLIRLKGALQILQTAHLRQYLYIHPMRAEETLKLLIV